MKVIVTNDEFDQKAPRYSLNVNDAGTFPITNKLLTLQSQTQYAKLMAHTFVYAVTGRTAYSISPLLSNSHISLATTQLSRTIRS